MAEPPFRFSTKKALDELAIELNLREKIPHWDSMAGLSYTPGNPADIQAYLVHYAQLRDDDKKWKTAPKCNFMRTHTARRSAATNGSMTCVMVGKGIRFVSSLSKTLKWHYT